MRSSESDGRAERRRLLLALGATAAVAVCTLWLATTGRLGLYINPRYLVFTVVLAAIAVPSSVAALVAALRGEHGDHEHGDHEHQADVLGGEQPLDATVAGVAVVPPGREERRRPARMVRRSAAGIAAVVVVAVALAMLVLPPATLSARTAEQRAVDTGTLTSATGTSGAVGTTLLGASAADTSGYGVKDWASAIRQTTDTSALTGQRLALTGFVVRSGGTASFTLTRFVISCCAVDAQPVGIVVLAADDPVPASGAWVRVTGALVANPDASAGDRLVVRPSAVTTVHEPSNPYEY